VSDIINCFKVAFMRSHPTRLAAALLVAATWRVAMAQVPAPQPAPINAQEVIPFDAAVRTGTLPNGVKFFIRHNGEPANRVSLQFAVKAGSLNEADDQLGLAHLIEHMAFNGSAHFKSGELISAFEAIGARLGPHVNASTSFDETVYQLELPSDKPEMVTKGLTAMADFGGGLTLDPAEIDKERGVVIEEWRGGLGASSRIRDKQLPVLFYRSRYADRLPIGKPEIIRSAPAARLRAFYDTWYRPDQMAIIVVGDVDAQKMEQEVRTLFGPLAARAPAAPEPDRTVPLHKELLVNVTSDPEVTRSSVQLLRKRAHDIERGTVGGYRRGLVQQLADYMIGERFTELARQPESKFLSAGSGGYPLSRTVDAYLFSASVQDGRILDGLTAVEIEANRVRRYGFGSGELARAKSWMAAFMERAYNERDKTESDSYASEYLNYFLDAEPSPGIAYEYKLVQQLLPAITADEVSNFARTVISDDSRVLLATSPEKAGVPVPTESDLRSALAAADAVEVTPWTDTTVNRELVEKVPPPAAVVSRRELPNVGVTVVKFANGVEAYLKPTDFKNDQVVFELDGDGGFSTVPCNDIPEASLATSYVGVAGIGGLKPTDLQKLLAGKLASASPYVGMSTHGISGGGPPTQLETALQLLYLNFTAPNDDPEAFTLLTRQLAAGLANRLQSPQQIFSDKLADVNTSGHCTSKPLTAERVQTLDRAKMQAFYRSRFANAADFTLFMVGAFKIDDVLPLLARYVGGLPSTGKKASSVVDLGIRFPEKNQVAKVIKGREPRAQTVMSFFDDPSPAPLDQEYAIAATTVLDIALRDALREELGQTYTVGVGLSEPLPQRGAGHIRVQFGSAPENVQTMTDRVIAEIKRLQQNGPSDELTNKAKESARRTYETALRDNGYWLGRISFIHRFGGDLGDILTRNQRIDTITPQLLQDVFKKSFPLDRYTVVTLLPEPGQ
jgi:zinc protease